MTTLGGLAVWQPSFVLDVVSASFGRLLRAAGVSASPAEVIEVRRVLAMVGASDRETLRACLRAVCAKYSHEQAGFDRAFDALFRPAAGKAHGERMGSRAEVADGLPTALGIDEDQEVGRYAEYNERAAEVGDYFDTPEAEKGFNPHKDDDDVSMTSSDAELSVDTGSETGRRGVSYTVDVDRAASAVVGDLSISVAAAVVGSLSWDDPTSILAWLDAYDPSKAYADVSDDGPLTQAQLNRLVEAVEAFVQALSAAALAETAPDAPDSESAAGATHNDIELACHEVLRRMRGPSRPRPRERSRGHLDMRRTVRSSLRTDGIPFHLVVKAPRPDRVRLLLIADV